MGPPQLKALRGKDEALNLTVPDLINYSDNVYARFSGVGGSLLYDDVFVGRYYEYLADRGVKLGDVGVDDLKRHHLVLTNEDGDPRDSFSIYKSLIFDTSLKDGAETYHLCEGNWYRVEHDYVARLEQQLDPLCIEIPLPSYKHDSEGAYNEAVAAADNNIVCLDRTNISPIGQSQVEPCDLYSVKDNTSLFHHVKVSTLSSQLSHLFNQGTNAIELIRSEDAALDELKRRIKEKGDAAKYEEFIAPLGELKHQVTFAIVTHKDKAEKSKNLPLFSRISLARSMKHLKAMNVSGRYGFIKDKSPKKAGKKKQRKGKQKAAG